ncbi:IPIL1 protein, partial [Urocolius indicus]|nr:IPIL1 protein [Urocolius indicus]
GKRGHGEDRVYHLLVPLKPPPGHSFELMLDSKGKRMVRNSLVCVDLKCMCTREKYLGDVLCFLHHPERQLVNCQEASLLQTLCTGPYLDAQKTLSWFQELMAAACVLVSQASPCKLLVLPSAHVCRIRMINSSHRYLFIELVLVLQQGNSDAFVTL